MNFEMFYCFILTWKTSEMKLKCFSMGDQWRCLGSEIFKNNFISTCDRLRPCVHAGGGKFEHVL